MKLLKEHPFLGLCLVLYIAVMALLIQKDEVVSLNNYKQTEEIIINDGGTGNKTYPVHVSTVENALNDLGIVLGEEDTLNLELSHELQDTDILEITRVVYEEYREEVAVPYTTEYVESEDETLIGTRLVHDGENGTKDVVYTRKLVNGQEVERVEIGSEITKEPVAKTFEVGSVTTGQVFTGKLTSYGADCIGCGTRTAAGLYVTINGVKNEGKATLTYNGTEYYVLAADPQFPFGTIVKISNHSYNLPDPLYGIVLDRGGAVKGTTMDIFSGSQRTPLFGGHGSTVTYEIIQRGNGRTSIY